MIKDFSDNCRVSETHRLWSAVGSASLHPPDYNYRDVR